MGQDLQRGGGGGSRWGGACDDGLVGSFHRAEGLLGDGQGAALPDPSQAGDLSEFAELLERLRAWAGNPSFRLLAKKTGPLLRPPRVLSHATLANAFQPGRRRLDMDLVVAVVRALGLEEDEVDRWRQACVRIHAEARTGGPVGVFRQLPAELATFTGRDTETRKILDAATGPRSSAATVVISAIGGMAGVGKTRLAIHAAHVLARSGQFADVQLFVDLRGFDPDQTPTDPSVVLDAFLRQLEVPPQRIPARLDERAAMFRDRLHGKRALIVLDNAANEDQVRHLIPAADGAMVLVTSRRTLAGLDGATLHLLDVFDDAEAIELLGRIAGHDRIAAEPEAAASIVEACGRLPLAVSLAAARLRTRPLWTLAELAERLCNGDVDSAVRIGQRGLSSAFELSYSGLPEPSRRLYGMLGIFPGQGFTAPAVAALTGSSVEQARSILEDLLDEHLLQQKAAGRYELHDLLHAYVLGLARAEHDHDRAAAISRLASWYLATACAAAAAVGTRDLPDPLPRTGIPSPEFGDHDAGLQWFDDERENLVAIAHAASAAGLHDHVWRLATTQKQYALLRRSWPDWERLLHLGEISSQALNDRSAQARMLWSLGTLYWQSGNLTDAEKRLDQAAKLYRTLGDPARQVSVLMDLASVVQYAGRLDEAVQHHEMVLPLVEQYGDVRLKGIFAMNYGATYFFRGLPSEALTWYERGLADLRASVERRSEALMLINVVAALRELGDTERALAYCQEADVLARALGDSFLIADNLMDYGDLLKAAGQHADAVRAWQEAVTLFEKIEHADADKARRRLAEAETTMRPAWSI